MGSADYFWVFKNGQHVGLFELVYVYVTNCQSCLQLQVKFSLNVAQPPELKLRMNQVNKQTKFDPPDPPKMNDTNIWDIGATEYMIIIFYQTIK